MKPIGVMHVVDALRVGGAERVALDLANLMPQAEYRTYLCSTREEGPFASRVAPHVGRLSLFRKSMVDLSALRKIVSFIKQNDIRILHAHGSALFFTKLASLFSRCPAIVWHDHYGRHSFNDRPAWLYKRATAGVGGVIAVNQALADWSRKALGIPSERVWFVPNLVEIPTSLAPATDLPGQPGKRIVCVANIRPQKDHANLLKAMALVVSKKPAAHLLLVGDFADEPYKDEIVAMIGELSLEKSVTYLGRRADVTAILQASDVAVLSSLSEGLPISLLEYGAARLPAVSTAVGQCPDVLGHGIAGLLVPPAEPQPLADALLSLLDSESERRRLGAALFERVVAQYSSQIIVDQVSSVYTQVLTRTYTSPKATMRPAETSHCKS